MSGFSFSSFQHRSHKWRIIALTICLFSAAGSPLVSAQSIQKIYAGAVQSTPDPIPACITTGYGVDATLSFPLLGDTPLANQATVELSRRSDRIGYFVTRNNTNSTEVWIYVYDAVTMTYIRGFQLQSLGQLDYAGTFRLAAVYRNDLYLVRIINSSRLGCGAGRTCASITKIQANGTVSAGLTVDLVTASFGTLDDFTILSDGTAMLSFGDGVGRRLAAFDAPSQTFLGFGPTIAGFSGQGRFGYVEDGVHAVYVGESSGLDIALFSPGATTPTSTSAYAYSFSNTNGALTTALELNRLLGFSDTFAGTAANIAYKDLALLTVQAPASYLNSTDGSASVAGTYYDSVNHVVHSLRSDGGGGAPTVIRSTVSPFVIQQRFGCGAPCFSSTYRLYNFALPTARFYIGSSSGTTGTVTRIKVCATGGPPA